MSGRSLPLYVPLAGALAVLLVGLGCARQQDAAPAPAPAPAPASAPAPMPAAAPPAPVDDARLIQGDLPEVAGVTELLHTRCVVCHSTDYLTQQRLTAAQWDKTLAKMQKWGATLSDDEKVLLGGYLSERWRVGLAERKATVVPPPSGALPAVDAR